MRRQARSFMLLRRTPLLVPVFVLALTVLGPLLGGYGRYLLALYVVMLPWVLTRPVPKPSRAPFLYTYIASNILALVFHLNAPASVLNAGALLVSIIATAGTAYFCVRHSGAQRVDLALERSLWVSFILSLVLSIMLTTVGWPTAPDYFPWEAFYSEKRFLLISGDGVGHTASLWVMAFLSAFTIHRIATQKRHRAALLALLGVLVLCLLATKSRLPIVYLANLLVMGLAYKKFPFARAAVALVPATFAVVFLAMSIFPSLGAGIDVAARAAQQQVGDRVRLTPGEETGATVFAGRDILNQALVSASLEKPLHGLGDDADILSYGVDGDGNVAYDPDHKRAATESVLRLAVKYGWPYFAVLMLFLGSIPFALKHLPWREQILKVGLWGMCVESIASEGGMEMFYGLSGLFLFVLCSGLFQATSRKRHASPNRTLSTLRPGITPPGRPSVNLALTP